MPVGFDLFRLPKRFTLNGSLSAVTLEFKVCRLLSGQTVFILFSSAVRLMLSFCRTNTHRYCFTEKRKLRLSLFEAYDIHKFSNVKREGCIVLYFL